MYWVIYDISENKVRSKIVRLCKNFGLRRVQKSAFLGLLSKNKAEMLYEKSKEVLEESDCVFFLPACRECFKSKIIAGEFDEDKFKEKDFVVV